MLSLLNTPCQRAYSRKPLVVKTGEKHTVATTDSELTEAFEYLGEALKTIASNAEHQVNINEAMLKLTNELAKQMSELRARVAALEEKNLY